MKWTKRIELLERISVSDSEYTFEIVHNRDLDLLRFTGLNRSTELNQMRPKRAGNNKPNVIQYRLEIQTENRGLKVDDRTCPVVNTVAARRGVPGFVSR